MEFNKRQAEVIIVQQLSFLLDRKVKNEELVPETYLLHKDEIIQVPTIDEKPLPQKVMAYFYGCESYIGFLITDSQQRKLLAVGILDSNNQLVKKGEYKNE
ncbi:hypothetical protein FC19_GL001061 [Liquorilactobacillus aquaticus DSM 21051]|uniref:Uncharacterized protein n=1 Tax=Liquorilactobacillus aquaticus DSM 21051 TaxID=1423725 RepID=A0A0R2CVZ1_9LACO|nr:hypothetical protein [Liquorilactobacillus aquaticus]KRM95997.1 hypothetical protein FC19_GL001061 [Liquorilactobacillus aquaticus DSM 21051]